LKVRGFDKQAYQVGDAQPLVFFLESIFFKIVRNMIGKILF
jgi:hypothetical protein